MEAFSLPGTLSAPDQGVQGCVVPELVDLFVSKAFCSSAFVPGCVDHLFSKKAFVRLGPVSIEYAFTGPCHLPLSMLFIMSYWRLLIGCSN